MRAETKESIALVGKSVLLVLGGTISVAALVELGVGGPGVRAFVYLVAGLALAIPPLALSFRDAVRAKRRA
ncbi:MAG: hypothetical protein WDA16_01730 [Candidatus Thermoplasmatota archaeon]